MAREILNKDGSPMREYYSEIIEELLMEARVKKTMILTRKQTKKLMPFLRGHYKNCKLFINGITSKSTPLDKFMWDRRLGYKHKRRRI
jgi:hypothetical protein